MSTCHSHSKHTVLHLIQNKPRGRIFYLPDEDRFVVTTGKWLEEYPEAKELVLEEFDLPAQNTVFEYAIHWDIGHSWC